MPADKYLHFGIISAGAGHECEPGGAASRDAVMPLAL
jgi:hypothetical protein